MAELTIAETRERVKVQEREIKQLKRERDSLALALERFAPQSLKALVARFKHERTG